MIGARRRSRDHHPRERGEDRLRVVAIGARDGDRQGRTPLIGQEVPFRAGFASIRGVRTRLRPPKGAFTLMLSSDWNRHRRSRNSSYRASNFAHSFSKMPARSHSWKRLWHVDPDPNSLGTAFHWQPVRNTYKMPSSTVRNGTWRRPTSPRGRGGGSNGSSSFQRSSGIRQIVASFFRFEERVLAARVSLRFDVLPRYYHVF